jgi:hypothetical protein
MSKEYGYIGKEVNQEFFDNKGIFNPEDVIRLDQENKWSTFGQLEHIQTQTASNVATLSFDSIKETEYKVHFITMSDYVPTVDNRHIRIRFKNAGTTDTGNSYEYAMQRNTASTGSELKSAGDTKMWQVYSTGSATNETAHGYCYVYNAGDSNKFTYITTQYTNINKDSNQNSNFTMAVYRVANQVSGIEFGTSGDNISRATFSLYGIRGL